MQLPSPLEGIPRVSFIKILGVTVSNHLSVSEHVASVIGRCAKKVYMPSECYAHKACVMKPYIVSIIIIIIIIIIKNEFD